MHVQSIPVLCGDTALFQIYLSQIIFLWIGDITFCFFIKCDYSLQFELMKLTFNNKITTIEKKCYVYKPKTVLYEKNFKFQATIVTYLY